MPLFRNLGFFERKICRDMLLSQEDYIRVMESMPVVCVDCLVRNEKRQFLLVRRLNEPLQGEFWMPGGRLWKNERLHAAVHRKMREEIGVDVDILENIGYFEEFFDRTAQNAKGGFHAISFVFLVRPLSSDIRLDPQSGEWGWFDDIPARLKAYKSVRTGNNLWQKL